MTIHEANEIAMLVYRIIGIFGWMALIITCAAITMICSKLYGAF